MAFSDFDTLPKAAFFIFNQRMSIRVFGRHDTGGGMDRCADRQEKIRSPFHTLLEAGMTKNITKVR